MTPQAMPNRRALPILLVVLGSIAPIALFVSLRLSVTHPVALEIPGLPLTEPWNDLVRFGCLALVASAGAVAIAAIRLGEPTRQTGREVLFAMAISAPFVLVLFFLSIYGDPGVS